MFSLRRKIHIKEQNKCTEIKQKSYWWFEVISICSENYMVTGVGTKENAEQITQKGNFVRVGE